MEEKQALWLPEAASTYAGDVDSLFYFILVTSVIIFVGVVAAMVLFAWRFRRRSASDRPTPVKENKVIETSWILVPAILVTIVFVWGFRVFIQMNVPPPNAMEITVRAQKWSWLFEYPNGARFTELHVPVSRPVKLKMSSADVLHSFFVPAFRTKQDVIPGRYTYAWFEATRQDTFPLMCTEYCGQQHSNMLSSVIVLSQDSFNAWLQESLLAEDASPAERGELLYTQQGCFACHSLDGTQGTGPTLQGLAGTERVFTDGTSAVADDNYLREAITQPAARIVQGFAALMPATYALLEPEEIDALVAFIKEQ